ncbi:MAG: hypothetical protein WDW36_004823 [Sanguina aurantia]
MHASCNAATLTANSDKAPMWGSVLDMLRAEGAVGKTLQVRCQNHEAVTDVRDADDFHLWVGDGGCQLSCDTLLPLCGHRCPRRCHADDPGHVLSQCCKPCDRLHSPCGHPCHKLCHQECGRCGRVEQEAFLLPCGHSIKDVQCWRRHTAGEIQCQAKVTVTMPGCGHALEVRCCNAVAVQATPGLCDTPVEVAMPVCGHALKVPCGKAAAFLADPLLCSAACEGACPASHPCSSSCGACMSLSIDTHPGPLIKGRDQSSHAQHRLLTLDARFGAQYTC